MLLNAKSVLPANGPSMRVAQPGLRTWTGGGYQGNLSLPYN